MNNIVPTRRMPKHLQGTRRGLFFLLQSTPNLVSDDVSAMRAPVQAVSPAPQPAEPKPDTADTSAISAFLSSDDFHFNL